MTTVRRLRSPLWLALLAAGACETAPAPQSADPSAEIVAALEASVEEWNRGNLEGFLEPYLDSPRTTFVGSSGLLRGKDAIEARYLESYWGEEGPGQTLRFAQLEVRPLGDDHALVTGRYQLYGETGEREAEGPFSLVFARTPDGWRIIHDHSS